MTPQVEIAPIIIEAVQQGMSYGWVAVCIIGSLMTGAMIGVFVMALLSMASIQADEKPGNIGI